MMDSMRPPPWWTARFCFAGTSICTASVKRDEGLVEFQIADFRFQIAFQICDLRFAIQFNLRKSNSSRDVNLDPKSQSEICSLQSEICCLQSEICNLKSA